MSRRSRLAAAVLLTTAFCLVPSGAAQADGAPTWVWPTSGAPAPAPQVARRFEPPVLRWSPGHRGADLVAAEGSRVHAAGTGVVRIAGLIAGRGVVVVGHPDGTRTTYEPVLASVSAGETVAAGQPVGTLSPGGGHCLPRVCLHWGRRSGDVYLDPLALMGRRGPPRLLPVWVAGPLAASGGGSEVHEARVARPPTIFGGASELRASTARPQRAASAAEPADRSRWSLIASTSGASIVLLLVPVLLAGVRSAQLGVRTRPPAPGQAGRSGPDT